MPTDPKFPVTITADIPLVAPCVFCAYDGEDYWQRGTHAEACPWHTVGGFAFRLVLFREQVRNIILEHDEWEAEARRYKAAHTELAGTVDRLARELESTRAAGVVILGVFDQIVNKMFGGEYPADTDEDADRFCAARELFDVD